MSQDRDQKLIAQLERQNWILNYALTEAIRQFDYGHDMEWVKKFRKTMLDFGAAAYDNLKK